MPSPVLFLLIATLLPLTAAAVLLFIGHRMGTSLAGWVGSTFVVLSFAFTIFGMVKWYEGKPGVVPPWGYKERPILLNYNWTPAGQSARPARPGFLSVGIYVDSLTISMFAMVTLIAAVTHIFSISFMRDDPRFARFCASTGLLTFAVLGLVFSATILQLLVFCELIGFATFLLVRMWRGNSTVRILRALVGQMIGAGLIVGIGILIHDLGNVSLPTLWVTLGDAAAGQPVALSGGVLLTPSRLTLIGILLFSGAAALAAQFPVHFWLPRTMTFPAPAGSMITSATTAAAGIYLLARVFPILTPDTRLLICIVGVVTLTMASLIAVAQDDIRRLLGWIAVSQLGYITLALGVGGWVGGLFHLMTHAFFMAALLLSALSLTSAMGGIASLRAMRGLWKKLPVTMVVFALAALALAGAPFFSGYYSRLMIVTDAAANSIYATRTGLRSSGYWLFLILPAAAAYLTSFSITRCWMKAFTGKLRTPTVSPQTHEHAGQWAPLLALAVPCVIAGYSMSIPELLQSSIMESNVICNEFARQGSHFTPFNQTWAAKPTYSVEGDGNDDAADFLSPPTAARIALQRGGELAHGCLKWSWIVGLALAAGIYWNAGVVPKRLLKITPLGWVHQWLSDSMYLDELREWTVARPLLAVIGFSLRTFSRLWK